MRLSAILKRQTVRREGEVINFCFVPRNVQHLFELVGLEDLNSRPASERQALAVERDGSDTPPFIELENNSARR